MKIKDTSTQWDLIAAGVEEGVIDCFELEGKGATKMKRAIADNLQQEKQEVAEEHRNR